MRFVRWFSTVRWLMCRRVGSAVGDELRDLPLAGRQCFLRIERSRTSPLDVSVGRGKRLASVTPWASTFSTGSPVAITLPKNRSMSSPGERSSQM